MTFDLDRYLRRISESVSGVKDDAERTSPAVVTPTPEQEAKPDPVKLIREVLELEGCKPTVDDDGYIRFKYRDYTMCVVLDSKDPEYVRVILPNFWSIAGAKELARAQVVADRVNRSVKSVKVYTVNGNNVWVSIEMYVASVAHLCQVLMRCVATLERSVQVFGAGMALE